MAANATEVKGAVKISGFPEGICFKSFEDLLKQLPNFLTVEIPQSITNVVVSNIQPLDSQRDSVWFRRDNSGTIIGIYVFSGVKWKQLWPVPGGIFWVYSADGSVPEGYSKIDTTRTDILSSVISEIMAGYVLDNTDTFDVYFAVTFQGL